MRKALSSENPSVKEGSGRRYWMRANPIGPKAVAGEPSGKRGQRARFLEPYRLSQARRAALIDLLERGCISDRDGRELFASAIEYDIANARQTLARDMRPPAPPQTTEQPADTPRPNEQPEAVAKAPALPADLAHTARSLAERIVGLDGPMRTAIVEAVQALDPFGRSYDGTYLDALGVELRRLADAVASEPRDPEPTAAAPPAPVPVALDPPLDEGARRFLRRVARVYEEVLESTADPSPGGTFEAVLRLASEEAGIVLPRDPAALADALRAA
jgi:hypothetical protein